MYNYASLFFVLFSMLLIPAYSQSINSIQVFTDKPVYYESDIIQISGSVNPVIGSTLVSIVISHEASFVDFAQIELDENADFAHNVIAGGPSWIDGEYTVIVNYEDQSAETDFQYFEDIIPSCSARLFLCSIAIA